MSSTLSETAEPTTEAPLDKESRNGDAPVSHPVLIVDDKEENRFSFRKSLRAAGFEVEEAVDGMAALHYLLKNSASLVLLDVQMPGMNGFEVAQAIRQAPQHADLPILFVTATHRSDDFINYGYSVGAYDYLTKPVDNRLLVNKVKLFHTLYEQQRALQHANQQMVILNASLEQGRTALQQEKHYMERVLDSMSEALLVVGPDATIRDCNPALQRLSGLQREALLGRPFGTLFEEEVLDKLLSLFQSRLQRIHDRDHDAFHQLLLEAPVPVVVVNLDRELETIAPIFIISHEMERLLGHPQGELAGRSVLELLPEREQQRLQQRMEQSSHTLECAEEQRCNWLHAEGYEVESRVCMIHIDCSGRNHIVVQLQTAQSLAPELLAMTPYGKVFAEEEEEEVSADRMLVNAAGTQIPVAINAALLHNPDGAGSGAVLVVHDLRERIQAERMAREAAYHGGISEMSSHMLHNFGNDITGVRYYFDELFNAEKKAEQLGQFLLDQQQRIDQGEEGGVTLGEVGTALLDYSKSFFGEDLKGVNTNIDHMSEILSEQQAMIKDGNPFWYSFFSLSEVLDSSIVICRDLLDRARVRLESQYDETIDDVELAKSPFQQMVINLLKNSVEAIEQRYQNELQSAGREAADRVESWIGVSTRRLPNGEDGEGRFELIIEDNGVGLPPREARRQIFAATYTTKPEGSGQGLHSVGNFVSSMNGEITAEDRDSAEGACFRVVLPMGRL